MSTDTGTSTAAVICLTRVTTSSYVMPSWSSFPTESAIGWLPTVSATNPASTASRADQASQTVGKTTGLPGWCNASNASARSLRTWLDIDPPPFLRRDLSHAELHDVASIGCRTVIRDTFSPRRSIVYQDRTCRAA